MTHPAKAVFRSIALVALVGAALTACSSSGGSSSGSTLSSTDVTGIWTQKDSKPVVDLELLKDGTVTGTDGCNTMNGTWSIKDTTVEFGTFASTMMACDGVDTWLSGATSATVDGTAMTVLNDKGTKIGTLTKGS